MILFDQRLFLVFAFSLSFCMIVFLLPSLTVTISSFADSWSWRRLKIGGGARDLKRSMSFKCTMSKCHYPAGQWASFLENFERINTLALDPWRFDFIFTFHTQPYFCQLSNCNSDDKTRKISDHGHCPWLCRKETCNEYWLTNEPRDYVLRCLLWTVYKVEFKILFIY